MLAKIPGVGEVFVAFVAFEQSFAGVLGDVLPKARSLTEAFVAELAAVGLLAGVRSEMGNPVALEVKLLFTKTALVLRGRFQMINLHVGTQLGPGFEFSLATGTVERLLLGVSAYMVVECAWVTKLFVAVGTLVTKFVEGVFSLR